VIGWLERRFWWWSESSCLGTCSSRIESLLYLIRLANLIKSSSALRCFPRLRIVVRYLETVLQTFLVGRDRSLTVGSRAESQAKKQ
jgi:hypothetical protein